MRTTLLTTLLLAGVLSAATISPTPPKQTNKKKAKLYQAGMKALKTNCPTTAAKAAKGRKILVVNLCAGFPHSSIPLVAQAIEAMGKSTGAYEADFTNDMTAFDDAVLKGYDAVVLNNTTKLPVSASQKKALMDFVKSGKGLVGIHAAADNFYDWPEGAAMVGGLFDGHPWRYNMSSKFKVEGKSPLTAMFPQGGFRYTEEIYQLKAPYSRKALRIVLSLDMSDKKTAAVKGKKRTDNDYAIAFCQKIGKGRSFYTGIGHNETVVSDAAVLKHYLAGIQYAIGDLAVDDSPSGELKAAPVAAPVAVKIGTGAFAELLDYTYAKGQTKTATMLQDIVRTTPAAQYPALEARLLATYSSPKATVDCKTVCLETLRPVASCATTRVIGPGLVDAKLSDSVRAVLEGITCPRANPALRDALGKTDNDTIKAGLISTLAARGDTDAASLIAASLTSKNATLRMVAIKAIGRIGNPDCAPVLQGLKFTGPEATASNIAIAQCLVTTPKNLARFVAGLTDPATKAVALGILARADTSLAIIPLLDALDANDKILAKAANSILNSIRGDAFTKAVASAMPGAPAAKQAKLITILSGRPGPMAAKGIRAAATSKDPVVQQAVATALGAMGSAADLPAVLSLIASANADVAAAAKAALGTMPGDDVNAALIAYLAKCSGDDKLLPLNALAERKAPEAYPVFLAHAADLEDRKAFAVSIRALADYGTIAQIEPLTKLYLATPASGYTKAITAIATRSTDVEARSAAVAAALPGATGKTKEGLLKLAPKLGGKNVLKIVQGLLTDKDLGNTATRALCEWSTPEPMADLLSMCKTTDDKALKVLTMRGYLTQLTMRTDLTPAAISAKAIAAWPLAIRPEEKRMILSVLEKAPTSNGLDFVKTLKDAEIAQEIKTTESRLADALTVITMTASHSANQCPPKNALDNDPATRWGTGVTRRPGMWVIFDLQTKKTLSGLTLKYAKSANDGPSGYTVFSSNNAKNWTKITESKAKNAKPNKTDIKFGKSVTARYIKIVQNGRHKNFWWAIHKVEFKFSN